MCPHRCGAFPDQKRLRPDWGHLCPDRQNLRPDRGNLSTDPGRSRPHQAKSVAECRTVPPCSKGKKHPWREAESDPGRNAFHGVKIRGEVRGNYGQRGGTRTNIRGAVVINPRRRGGACANICGVASSDPGGRSRNSSARRVQTSAERSTATGEAALVRTFAVRSQTTQAERRYLCEHPGCGPKHSRAEARCRSARNDLRPTLGEELNKV